MSANMDFARAALAQRRPSSFLSLAPATSESYPLAPSRPSSMSRPLATTERSRRSSSGPRVLKLGPVYWGEHVDDHQEDFYAIDDLPVQQPQQGEESPPSAVPASSISSSSSAAAAAPLPQSSFLSLAPAVSDSYPRMPTSDREPPSSSSRRSSSSSSTSGLRVLKLGPVYWGQHADEHKADFHDVPSP